MHSRQHQEGPTQIGVDALMRYATALLEEQGVDKTIATDVAQVLVTAEMRGFASHGLVRLGRILTGLQCGTHSPTAEPHFEIDAGAVLRVDGRNGLGAHAGCIIMRRLIERAPQTGIAMASARRMTHFGFGGYFTELAAASGLIGITVCNTEPAAVPFGGRNKVLGTNPISFSCRSASHGIITVDMATTASARGRLLAAKMTGERLPPEIAVGPDGAPTTDPESALNGALLPLGGRFGYKGTGLGVMVDLLSGALAGASTGQRIKGTVTTTEYCSAGYLFIVIDPEAFVGHEAFESEVSALAAELRASGEDVLLPGAKEHASEEKARTHGVPLSPQLLSNLQQWGAKYGLRIG